VEAPVVELLPLVAGFGPRQLGQHHHSETHPARLGAMTSCERTGQH
jgi:hypothetical protein